MTRTFAVTYRGATVTLSGDVTACCKEHAIDAAHMAWNVTEPGQWEAHPVLQQSRDVMLAQHADMDETMEAIHV